MPKRIVGTAHFIDDSELTSLVAGMSKSWNQYFVEAVHRSIDCLQILHVDLTRNRAATHFWCSITSQAFRSDQTKTRSGQRACFSYQEAT